jgi:hypothetical protein
METAMKRIPILFSALVLAASTSAFAQNDAKTPLTPQQGATGHAGQADPVAAGANSAGGGTLMQKREKGMSPEGASDAASGKATGKIKQ